MAHPVRQVTGERKLTEPYLPRCSYRRMDFAAVGVNLQWKETNSAKTSQEFEDSITLSLVQHYYAISTSSVEAILKYLELLIE